MTRLSINEVSGAIVDAAMQVHRELGPGILESAYEACLAYELGDRGFEVQRQIELPIQYKGNQAEAGYRLDLVVNNLVIVELKAVSSIAPIHKAQLLSYLKLSQKKVGLLINFHEQLLKDGIIRLAN